MTATDARDLVAILLMLAGAAFILVAALGLLRMPDLPMRLHATSKAGTLGAGLILAGVAVFHWELGVTTRGLVTVFFLILTGPVAAHLIARSGYFALRVKLWEGTGVNELAQNHARQAKGGEAGPGDGSPRVT